METKKGFITVATGNERYYILAYNLLLSYRYHSQSPMPFAILCDRRNIWTEAFDEVVILDNPACSYTDKLRILDLSPFDETLFLEADTLAYRDLNGLWDYFQDSPDIGLVGGVKPNLPGEGWWEAENLGELKERVDYKVMCQGGLYYIRNNGKDLPAIMETCRYIENHYLEYKFTIFPDIPEDETIFCLAASVHHFQPVLTWAELFAYYPEVGCLQANIRTGFLKFRWPRSSSWIHKTAYFIHFGTNNTISPQSDGFYNREVSRLTYRPNGREERKERVVFFIRDAVNKSRILRAIANLFPKELRNKYNKVKS